VKATKASALVTTEQRVEPISSFRKEAMQHYEAAIDLAPHLPRAHLNRGHILSKAANTVGALDAYATALALIRGTLRPVTASVACTLGRGAVKRRWPPIKRPLL
jgi:hypothetical protein